MEKKNKVVLYGAVMGNFDVENVIRYCDQNKVNKCFVYLEKMPVEAIQTTLSGDGRIEPVQVKKPRKEAKRKAEALTSEGTLFKLAKLEVVSDRSSFRGGC